MTPKSLGGVLFEQFWTPLGRCPFMPACPNACLPSRISARGGGGAPTPARRRGGEAVCTSSPSLQGRLFWKQGKRRRRELPAARARARGLTAPARSLAASSAPRPARRAASGRPASRGPRGWARRPRAGKSASGGGAGGSLLTGAPDHKRTRTGVSHVIRLLRLQPPLPDCSGTTPGRLPGRSTAAARC